MTVLSIDPTLKIAVLGAAGGIGQSMTLLLKTQLHTLIPRDASDDSRVRKNHIHLALYDVNSDAVKGVTTDLSHIDTPVTLSSHSPADANGMRDCLINTDLIIISAGMPRQPGMTRDDLFFKNAAIVSSLADSIAKYCDLSNVFILLISNPVNSLVPVMAKRLIHDRPSTDIEKRIMGVTKLDIVRASTFLHQLVIDEGIQKRTNDMPELPVIGGHSGNTIIPLFSRSAAYSNLSKQQLRNLITRVQTGGDEVVKAKNGQGSATLSMALAGYKVVAKFASLLLGTTDSIHGIYYVSLWDHLKNKPICDGAGDVLEKIDGCQFFSIPVYISKGGIYNVEYDILDKMDTYERDTLLPLCLSNLKVNIDTGLSFNPK